MGSLLDTQGVFPWCHLNLLHFSHPSLHPSSSGRLSTDGDPVQIGTPLHPCSLRADVMSPRHTHGAGVWYPEVRSLPGTPSTSVGEAKASIKSLEFHLVISLGKTSSLSEKPSEGTEGFCHGVGCLRNTSVPPPSTNVASILTVSIKEFLLGAVLRVSGNVLHAPLRQALWGHATCRTTWASAWEPG